MSVQNAPLNSIVFMSEIGEHIVSPQTFTLSAKAKRYRSLNVFSILKKYLSVDIVTLAKALLIGKPFAANYTIVAVSQFITVAFRVHCLGCCRIENICSIGGRKAARHRIPSNVGVIFSLKNVTILCECVD